MSEGIIARRRPSVGPVDWRCKKEFEDILRPRQVVKPYRSQDSFSHRQCRRHEAKAGLLHPAVREEDGGGEQAPSFLLQNPPPQIPSNLSPKHG